MADFTPGHNAGIYEIRNAINGNRYIGRSINLSERQRLHFWYLRHGTHRNPHLQAAFDKYGGSSFQFRVLFYCDPEMTSLFELLVLERLGPEYNLVLSSNGALFISEETRDKISRSHMGMKPTLGKKWTTETKRKMSLAARGEKGSQAKLKDQHIILIRYLRKRGVSGKSLAETCGVSPQTICDIFKRRTWSHA